MINRKTFLIFIFNEKHDNVEQYFGYWASTLDLGRLSYDKRAKYLNLISHNSITCPIANYSLFDSSKIKVRVSLIYNISGSNEITAEFYEPDNNYERYFNTVEKDLLLKSPDLNKIINYNNKVFSKNIEYTFNRDISKKNTEKIVNEKIEEYNIKRTSIVYDFGRYDYIDWKLVLKNNNIRFTISPKYSSGFFTHVEVLANNEEDKSKIYKIMKERVRVKGVFDITVSIDALFKMIKKIESIGTDDEVYDPEKDRQIGFKFK